jgi:hypothetical protein
MRHCGCSAGFEHVNEHRLHAAHQLALLRRTNLVIGEGQTTSLLPADGGRSDVRSN